MPSDLASSSELHARQRKEEDLREAERKNKATTHTLDTLLQASAIEHLSEAFHAKTTLNELQAKLAVNRPHLLDFLKELGVPKLRDRQNFANALAKAQREGQIAEPVAIQQHVHHKPPTFEDEDSTVTVRLKVPANTSSNQLKMHVEPHSLSVEYLGEATAVRGRLYGTVKPIDCGWQLERTPLPEYDPLLDASEQPPPPEDEMVITLQKERASAWPALFTDAVAKRYQPPFQKTVDAKAEALKKERQVAIDKRKHEMLYGKDITPMPPKNPELIALEQREEIERQRRKEKRRAQVYHSAPVLTANEHWQPAQAATIWREGLQSVAGAPDHPEESGALYTWVEEREAMVLRASTARGLPTSELRLQAGSNFVDCFVRDRPTPWCGVLVGKVDPARCKLEVVPATEPDAVCDTLQLTLAKAEINRLWRAPWPELVSQMELRERKSAANGHKPQREWLSIHGYDAVQTATEWEVVIPIKSGSALTHDDVHVAVTATSLNVHVVGQDDKPLVGGELGGRILPAKCTWHMREAEPIGTIKVEEIFVRLAKETTSMWRDLLKQAYT